MSSGSGPDLRAVPDPAAESDSTPPAEQKGAGRPWLLAILLLVGLFGAFLLYGDGMITPAISVLSAIEGLRIITPAFNPFLQFFYRSRTPTNEWDLSDVALAGSTFPLFVQKRA